eukprot:7926497-Alexandrium_andersonii.AAC.1
MPGVPAPHAVAKALAGQFLPSLLDSAWRRATCSFMVMDSTREGPPHGGASLPAERGRAGGAAVVARPLAVAAGVKEGRAAAVARARRLWAPALAGEGSAHPAA